MQTEVANPDRRPRHYAHVRRAASAVVQMLDRAPASGSMVGPNGYTTPVCEVSRKVGDPYRFLMRPRTGVRCGGAA